MIKFKCVLSSVGSLSLMVLVGCTQTTVINENSAVTDNVNLGQGDEYVNTNVTVVNENANAATDDSNTNIATDTVVDTSDWLTYSSARYGVLLKYPASWTVIDTEFDCLGLTSPERAKENEAWIKKFEGVEDFGTDAYFPYDITLCQEAANNITLEQWIESNVNEQEIISRQSVTIDGLAGNQIVIDNLGIWQRTYLLKDDILTIINTGTDNAFTDQTMVEAIIDSITIAAQTVDTTSWKTYANEQYNFSVRYPDDWVIFTSYSEDGRPSLNDEETFFTIQAKLPSWKKQDFTPSVNIEVAIQNIEDRIKELEKNSSNASESMLGGYKMNVYNYAEIIFEKKYVIPKRKMIISVRTDDDYIIKSPYKEIFQSITVN